MRIIPSDTDALAYSVPWFTVGRPGVVRLLTAGGELVTRNVAAGDKVSLATAAILRTGTTAGDFQTTAVGDYATRAAVVPFEAGGLSRRYLLHSDDGYLLQENGGQIVL